MAKAAVVKGARGKSAAAKPAPAKKAPSKPAAAKANSKTIKPSPQHAKLFALGHHLTHAVALEAVLKKSIKSSDIYKRLLAVLHQSYIDYNAPTSDYLKGDDQVQVLRAFAITLDHSAQFSGDGLNLSPGNLTDCQTMGDIGTAIVAWYSENGWTVLAE